MSAMAQGTAIQALARGSVLLADPSYLQRRAARDPGVLDRARRWASAVRRARRRQPLPALFVLARPARAERVRAEPERPLRLRDDRRSTCARCGCSRRETSRCAPSCPATTPARGRCTRSPARSRRSSTTSSPPTSSANLCEKLGPGPYCDAADRFEGYEAESPRAGAADLEARRGQPPVRAVRRSRSTRPCGCTISRERERRALRVGDLLATASARSSWKPARPGDYVVTLAAESFNGTEGSTSGTITVRAKS